MKIEALAEKSGLSSSAISQIETGKRGYSKASLEALATALGTKPGYLLEFDPRKGPNFFVTLA